MSGLANPRDDQSRMPLSHAAGRGDIAVADPPLGTGSGTIHHVDEVGEDGQNFAELRGRA